MKSIQFARLRGSKASGKVGVELLLGGDEVGQSELWRKIAESILAVGRAAETTTAACARGAVIASSTSEHQVIIIILDAFPAGAGGEFGGVSQGPLIAGEEGLGIGIDLVIVMLACRNRRYQEVTARGGVGLIFPQIALCDLEIGAHCPAILVPSTLDSDAGMSIFLQCLAWQIMLDKCHLRIASIRRQDQFAGI